MFAFLPCNFTLLFQTKTELELIVKKTFYTMRLPAERDHKFGRHPPNLLIAGFPWSLQNLVTHQIIGIEGVVPNFQFYVHHNEALWRWYTIWSFNFIWEIGQWCNTIWSNRQVRRPPLYEFFQESYIFPPFLNISLSRDFNTNYIRMYIDTF